MTQHLKIFNKKKKKKNEYPKKKITSLVEPRIYIWDSVEKRVDGHSSILNP